MRTKYRVKVRRFKHCWHASCAACPWAYARGFDRDAALREATRHAATCEALRRENLAAACPSCKAYGSVARACPVCLGRGFVHEREGLE